MMKLRSMTASFGKLKGDKLVLKEGLNLIWAPNEGGKSTWSAFYKAMLFGIDTRDRDKKGYLAVKNKYQPWSGAPMEGELILDWNGRELALRRGPKGSVPFGSFSAVYTDTGEKVPGMTGSNCGELLTGVSREVFERSAFLGGGELHLTAVPDLERRLTALLTAGEEDVSFSQVQSTLKSWLNRRQVNRSVGLIPKLEEELARVRRELAGVEDQTRAIAALEQEVAELTEQRDSLLVEEELHQKLARRELNARFAQAEEDYAAAQTRLEKLEGELARFGSLIPREELKQKQFDLQYLKVLEEEIRAAQADLEQAEQAYAAAQQADQDDHFPGLTAQQARQEVTALELEHRRLTDRGRTAGRRWVPLALLAVLLGCAGLGADLWLRGGVGMYALAGLGLGALCLILGLIFRHRGKKLVARAALLPRRFGAESLEELAALTADFEGRSAAAQGCAQQVRTIHGAIADRQARRENTRQGIFDFVHTFAPEVKELFGCSAALSRALNLEHELTAARERLAQCRARRDDLAAQGGQPFQTLEMLYPPERTREETAADLAGVTAALSLAENQLAQALGRRQAMGDPAALYAEAEGLEGELESRNRECEAITLAMEQLERANESLQRRFSPQLNARSGEYFAKLTGGNYDRVSLNRELEGEVSAPEGILPRSELYLSRGTADQLYLAVRLAVCALCLPDRPPILLDDALSNFDDERLKFALKLLNEIAEERQILLFTCHRREEKALEELT